MSALNRSVSAYSAPKQGWAGALWADKARLRRVLMIWGVGIFLAIAAVFYLVGGRYIGSDDSYVHANKLMVSTDVSGLVESVKVHEGQQVKAGDILFTLDPKPFQIALENAQAALAQRRAGCGIHPRLLSRRGGPDRRPAGDGQYECGDLWPLPGAGQAECHRRHAGGYRARRPAQFRGDDRFAAPERGDLAGQAERQSQSAGRADPGLSESQGGGG